MIKQGLQEVDYSLKSDLSNENFMSFNAETDTQAIIESLLIVEQLCPDQVLMLCNRSHQQLRYVGSNSAHVLGFNNKELEQFSIQDFFNRIHPDDLQAVTQCHEFMGSTDDPSHHRFVLFYRFKKKTGEYAHIRDERLAIENTNGKYIYFAICKNTEDKFYHVKLDVYRYNKGNSVKIYSYNPRQSEQMMTPRQNEIIRLITQGFSTQEIADRLHVSINTIKNHKQILFRKVNVKSSVELVNFATRLGTI